MASDPASPATIRSRLILFICILAVAIATRFVGLLQHATMPDEAFTFFIASHNIPAIIYLLKTGDFHPPLIYLIGHGLFALTTKAYLFRIVCAAVGVAGVVATYALARRIVPRWAWLAALLVALNSTLAFFDGFFRMYALLWSLCTMSWALLLWALDEPKIWWRWFAYALALVALLYTQYLAFFTVAAQILYVALFARRSAGAWISIAAAIIGFVPWLPIFFAQYPLGGSAYNALHGRLLELVSAPALLMVDGLPPRLEFAPLTLVLLWLLIIGGLAVAVRQRQWLLPFLFVPLVLQVGYSLWSGKLLVGQRYLLQVIPTISIAAALLLSWMAGARLRPLAVALAAALTVMTAAGTADKHFLPQYMPVDWTVYRSFLDSKMQPGDGVVFDGSLVYFVLVGSKAVTDRPLFLVANRAEAATLAAQAARLPRVWYVDYQSQLPDPQHIVFTTLLKTHQRHTSWSSTASGYGDVVLTTLFERLPAGKRAGP